MAKKSCKLVRDLSRAQAKNELTKKDGKIRLVQFHSPWCEACRETTPEVVKANQELCGEAEVCRVDADSAGKVADEFGIKEIPTVAIIQDGKIKAQVVGADTAKAFIDLVRRFKKRKA